MEERTEKYLEKILELYTDILQDQKRSLETISDYNAEIRRFFSWWAERGHQPFGSARVARQDIKAYLNDLERSNPPAACNRALAALRLFFAFCYWIHEPENNPTRTIPNLWDAQKASSWLDTEQQRQLEGVIDQQLQMPLIMAARPVRWVRSAVLVRFLLHTGMYSVEVRTLRLGDIRLGATRGVVYVRGRRERRLPLDSPTCAALRFWLTIRPGGEDGWLWWEGDRSEACQLSRRTIWRACRRMAQLAGLDPEVVSPRILRNTCAHNLLEAGESPRVVRRLLQFSSSKIPLRYL
jgi:integrase/recombinase XerD